MIRSIVFAVLRRDDVREIVDVSLRRRKLEPLERGSDQRKCEERQCTKRHDRR